MNIDFSYNYIIDLFKGNILFNILTFILAILGVALSVYFYLKSKKEKTPTYITKTINLVTKDIKSLNSLSISYLNETITNVSITKLAFWNSGKETISNTDISNLSPLRIVIDSNYKILESSIIYQKNASNNFRVDLSKDKHEALIYFDFFDFEEGVVIQLIHTGNLNKDITMTGSIKGVKFLKRKGLLSTSNTYVYKIDQFILKYLLKSFGYIFGPMLIISSFLDDYLYKEPMYNFKSYIIPRLILFTLGCYLLYMQYNTNRKYIPKGFDIFDDEKL